MAKIQDRSIYQLLEHDGLFQIPIYQRNYTWNSDDCLIFIKDIYDNFIDTRELSRSDGIEYFLGTIVLHNTSDGDYIIIDGQQRLTTAILILSATKYALKEMNLDKESQYIINKIDDLIFYRSNNKNGETKLKINNIRRGDILKRFMKIRNLFQKKKFKMF